MPAGREPADRRGRVEPSARRAARSGRWRRALAFGPAAAWALLVLWVGSRPDVPGPDTALPLDKVAHLTMYGVLGALLAWGWRRAGRWPAAAIPVLLGIALGAADEWGQRAIVTRSADPIDWLMDALGVGLGFWAAVRWWSHE